MEVITDTKSGLQFYVNGTTAESVRAHGLSEYPLVKWCEQYLNRDRQMLDIGIGVGAYTMILHRKCSIVHAFEMASDKCESLNVASCLNDVYNLEVHPVVLGSGASTTMYRLTDGTTTLSRVIAQQSTIEYEAPIQTVTLDSFDLTNICFIHLDTGHELEILRGATATLQNSNYPPIVFHSSSKFTAEADAISEFLRFMGYRIYPISGTVDMYLANDRQEPSPETEAPQSERNPIVVRFESGHKDFEAEEWRQLAQHYRLKSKHQLAYDCAMAGLAPCEPTERQETWGPMEEMRATQTQASPETLAGLQDEIGIVSFYIDKKDEGRAACETIIVNPVVAWNKRNLALCNISYYFGADQTMPVISRQPVWAQLPACYTSSAVSIVPREDGYRMMVRGVNYIINDRGNYIMRHEDNVVRTVNALVDVDADFNVQRETMLFNRHALPLHPGNIVGLEDIRLVGTKYGFATCLEVNERHRPQICWLTFEEDGAVSRLEPLVVKPDATCEKNWLPFWHDGAIHFIYSTAPFKLYRLNMETAAITLVKESRFTKYFLEEFRGSAPPIPYKGGWLYTVHQVEYSQPRKYYNRFVWWNADWTQLKFSRLFIFEKVGIEFGLSLCPKHGSDDILLTYSVHDASSVLVTVDSRVVDAYLADYSCCE